MDEALKQRLVGAVILIALAVIFLPILLTGTGQETGRKSDAELSLPPRPEPPSRQRRLPLEAERPRPAEDASPAADSSGSDGLSRAQAGSAAGTDIDDGQASLAPAGAAPDSAAPEDAATLDSEAAGTSPAEPDQAEGEVDSGNGGSVQQPESGAGEPIQGARNAEMPADQGWVIQAASFADRDNAQRLIGSLSELGFNPGWDRVDGGENSQLHRVWVGPFESRAQVEGAMKRIRDGIDHIDPRIRGDAPPAVEQAGAATPEGDKRFAVQMGVFGDQENATKLRTRLLSAGYSASTRRTEVNGSVRYRVLVGPLLSRSDANHIRGRINQDVGIEGMIVEYP